MLFRSLAESAGNVASPTICQLYFTSTPGNQLLTVLEVSSIAAAGVVDAPTFFVGKGDYSLFSVDIGENGQQWVSAYELYQAIVPNSAAYQPPN